MVVRTLKESYKRLPYIFSSSSERKIRSIKIHDDMSKPMSNSGSVSFCIPKCVIHLTQAIHELRYPHFKKSHFINNKINVISRRCVYILIYLKVLLTAMM